MSVAASLIRPLYHLGEHRPALRRTALRKSVFRALELLSRGSCRGARRAFETSPASPEHLPIGALDDLIDRYATGPDGQKRWDTRAPRDKAAARADEVRRSTGMRNLVGKRLVELACGDGRVAMHLARAGARVTGVDLSDHAFAQEAIEHVAFCKNDASNLSMAGRSVDALYSFDAFEHFADPAAVLREAHRVLKPGGVLYASFGPLWNSPFGVHQWGRLDVPYIHLLFSRPDLDAYADHTGRPRLTTSCNEKSLASFRRVFGRSSELFSRESYVEKFNVGHADLIEAYPACFRAKVSSFDELIVRSIEVTLRKL